MSHISLKGVNDLWDNTAPGLKTFKRRAAWTPMGFKRLWNSGRYRRPSAFIGGY
jgi:hypothetical protein